MASEVRLTPQAPADITTPPAGKYFVFLNSAATDDLYKKDSAGVSTPVLAAAGTVTSVSFTGGLISVATATTTPALTVAGTSGGVPYFSSASTWASSGVLAANSILIGGGAGVAPSSITTGTGVVTALGVNVGSAGAFVVFNGALGTPSSGTLTNCTGLPLTTGVTGVLPTANGGTGVNIASAALVLGTAISAAGSIVLQNATNANTLTINSGVTSASYSLTLPTAQGGASTYLKNDGAGVLSWATVASGISIGDAIGNSPVTGSVLMAIGGVITQSISYRAQQATPFGTAFGFASMAGNTGVNNTAFGYNAGLGQTTGTDNLYLGYNAGFRNITGNRNIYLGGITSDVALTNLSDNIFIGVGAGLHASGSQNIVVGAGDNTGSGLSTGNTVVGYRAMYNSSGSPTYNVAFGFSAGFSASGHGSVYLGALAGLASTYTRAIGIGILAQPSQNNEMMIGGVDSWFGGTGATVGITNVCIGNGNTYSTPSSVTLRITSASGSNIAGSTFTLAGSKATGTGAGGDIKHQTSVKGSSGTTVQTLGDRFSIVGKYVDLTAATATAFCRINIPTSTTAGGFVIATVEANDGTDFQARTFYISWAAANKAGTTTVGLDVPHEIVAATSGTLTGTMTLVDSGSGNIDFKMDASSSLAETTLRISFQVFKNFGTGAVSAS